LYRKGGDPRNIGLSLACAGRLHVDYGHPAEAETLLAEGLKLLESLQDLRGQAYCLNALGRLALFNGDFDGAASRFRQALRLNRSLGYLVDLSENLQELAVVKAGLGDELSASRLWAAAAGLQKRMGVSYPANDPLYRLPAARCLIESVQNQPVSDSAQLEQAIGEALEDELEAK
jgi:tetratricopeptide (TPR) repeat protein